MIKYLKLMQSAIILDTAYSIRYWSEILSTIIKVLISYYFWLVVYENRVSVSVYSFKSMITYILIAAILQDYVSGVGTELATKIRDGSIASELTKPYDLLTKLVALDLGKKLSVFVKNTLPIILISYFFLGIDYPHTWTSALSFMVSTFLGVLIGTQIDLIIAVCAFWTINVWGLRIMSLSVLMFFSGSLMPISLFPNWLRSLSSILPFQSMIYIPVSIYTGKIAGNEIAYSIFMQMIWLVFMFLGIRLIWFFALRRVTVYGG